MILILASNRDQSARQLAESWGDHGRLLTARDLSRPGWRYYPGTPGASRAVVEGRTIPFDEITGVITQLAAITEDELSHIAVADRSYVAAEMTAFLAAWLSDGSVRVVNRPGPTCLMGPNWCREQWIHYATESGMRIDDARRSTESDAKPGRRFESRESRAALTATVVGERVIERVPEEQAIQALRLARLAGVGFLTVVFSRAARAPASKSAFRQAFLGGDLSSPEIGAALRACFKDGDRAASAVCAPRHYASQRGHNDSSLGFVG